MLLVDSHCHLDFPDFRDELEQVLVRAKSARVGLLLTISTRLSTFDQVLAIAEQHEQVYCSVGIHPHEAGQEELSGAARLIELAQHPKVVGIGETGLDFYYEHSERAAQEKAFRAHIVAARETGLPLIVHTRDADAETAMILREEMDKGAFTGVIHCFTSSAEFAETALSLGFYISVSGIATFKSAADLRSTLGRVPLERLLVETDAPYLAPVPVRGKRNEPAFVAHTAAMLAKLKDVRPEVLAETTSANFLRLFSKIPARALQAQAEQAA